MKRSADAVLLKNGTVAVVEIFIQTGPGDIYALATQYQLEDVSPFNHIFREKESSRMLKLIRMEKVQEAMIVVAGKDRSTYFIKFLTAAENVRS